jgi:hypothetical protein
MASFPPFAQNFTKRIIGPMSSNGVNKILAIYMCVCGCIKDGHKVLKKEQSLYGNLGKTKEEKIVGVVKMGVCFLDEEFVKELTF